MDSTIPGHYDKPVYIAIIGGTSLSSLPSYQPVASLRPTTPWGPPSSPIHILEHPSHPTTGIAFLARHGPHHSLAPHEIPSRANIAALRALGVRCVIAFSAAGSLQEGIRPMDFVVPDQIIDRTRGVRPATFFEGGVVGHVTFGDPFDGRLGRVIREAGERVVAQSLSATVTVTGEAEEGRQREGGLTKVHAGGTLICMEGPQFSTRAESNLCRSWGGSVINMSALPEAKLAREAEIAYQMICMATDYDCWHVGEEDVDVSMVMTYMHTNSVNARLLATAILDELSKEEHRDLVMAKHWEGTAATAVKFCTKPEGRDAEAMKRVEYLFPGFWED